MNSEELDLEEESDTLFSNFRFFASNKIVKSELIFVCIKARVLERVRKSNFPLKGE